MKFSAPASCLGFAELAFIDIQNKLHAGFASASEFTASYFGTEAVESCSQEYWAVHSKAGAGIDNR
jgi:hypothetical protein